MKKILIISNVSGGLFSFRRELIEILSKEHDVTILASDTGNIPDFQAMGAKVIVTNLERHGTNPIKEMGLLFKYRSYLKEIRPDIVLTYTIKPNIYGGMACASLNIPYLTNITGLGTAVENPGKLQKMLILLYRFALRKAQKVFFQNEENMQFMLKNKIVKDNYQRIPGSGVNLKRYEPLPYPNNDTTDFVFIARITKEKGIDQYLQAAEFIRHKYPFTRFHICGGCEQAYQDRLKEEENKGNIIYHGKISDIAGMHAISSCTIHPSFYAEGLSNVLLESAACARPIITTDRAGCRDVVDDGVNGYIVKQRDGQDLIDKIEKFLALSLEERKQMGLKGREKVEKEFDRQIVIDAYLKEINK